MKITPTRIPEVLLIEPDVFGDSRGFFMESWHKQKFAEQGLTADFVQDNHSRSTQGVLRGLHYQLRQPQGKLGLLQRRPRKAAAGVAGTRWPKN